MRFDREKIVANVKKATTEDLLQRCTVFREGMEPEALAIIEEELHRRGVREADIKEYFACQPRPLQIGGLPRLCSFCRNPAVEMRWGWHRWWGKVPVFPRKFYYCTEHAEH